MAIVPVTGDFLLMSIIGRNSANGNCYIGLSKTTPASDGSNFTEPVLSDTSGIIYTSGYSRVLIGTLTGGAYNVMSVPVDNESENEQIIFFPEATETWGTMTHFGLFSDNNPSSKPYLYGALTSSVNIPANYVPIFRVGNLVLSIS